MVYRRTAAGERKREERLAKILAAAERLFAERGMHGTTMQEIAAEAGTSIGNLYFYFENKNQLLTSMVDRVLLDAYATSDALSARLPAGPARMALVVICNGNALLGPGSLVGKLLRQADPSVMTMRLTQRNTENVARHLAANFPAMSDEAVALHAAAWGGASRGAVQAFLDIAKRAGSEFELEPAMSFLVRFNLRGVGCADAEIDAALSEAWRVMRAYHAGRN